MHPGPEGQRDTLFPRGPLGPQALRVRAGHGSDLSFLSTEPASRGKHGGPKGSASGSPQPGLPHHSGPSESHGQQKQSSPLTSCSVIGPTRDAAALAIPGVVGGGVEVEGGLWFPGLCQPRQQSPGQAWAFV